MLDLTSFHSNPEPAPAPIDPEALSRAHVVAEQQLHLLTQLAEMGLELAAETVRRAKAEPLDAEAAEANHAMAYSRIARAVRMTLALQSRVMKELLALEQAKADGRRAAEAATAQAEHDRFAARRDRIYHIVNRIVEAEHHDDDAIGELNSDAWERLSDGDVYGDLNNRPIGEIVVEICRDLGLSPDWTRLAREAWAVEEGFSPQRTQGNAELAEAFDPPPFAFAPSALPRDLSG